MQPRLTDVWFEASFYRYTPNGTEEVQELMDAQGVFFWCPCGYGKPEFQLDGARPHGCMIPFSNPIFPTEPPPGEGPKWIVSGTGLHDLTLTPSIANAAPTPCWHGFITRGDVISV